MSDYQIIAIGPNQAAIDALVLEAATNKAWGVQFSSVNVETDPEGLPISACVTIPEAETNALNQAWPGSGPGWMLCAQGLDIRADWTPP